jgi:hypothetical protein
MACARSATAITGPSAKAARYRFSASLETRRLFADDARKDRAALVGGAVERGDVAARQEPGRLAELPSAGWPALVA